MQATQEHVAKLIDERHTDVRVKLDELINAFAISDKDSIHAANVALENTLHALGAVVAKEHWPSWLSLLVRITHNYRTNHGNGIATWVQHLRSVVENRAIVENHRWFHGQQESVAFDVDQLIDAARTEFGIDELFTRVITTLQGLVACEELDSSKAIRDLEEIISTLRRARDGSFSAQHTTWQFVRRFVPNVISAYVKRSAVAGPVIEAYEQTAAELDINLAKAKDQVADKLVAAAREKFKSQAIAEITTNDLSALPPQ